MFTVSRVILDDLRRLGCVPQHCLVGGVQVPLVPLTSRPECVTTAHALLGNHCTFGNSRIAGLYNRTSFLPSRFMLLCFAHTGHCYRLRRMPVEGMRLPLIRIFTLYPLTGVPKQIQLQPGCQLGILSVRVRGYRGYNLYRS